MMKQSELFYLKHEAVKKSLETLFFCRLDEGRASEGQVIAGSPPQVIIVEGIHSNILDVFYCFWWPDSECWIVRLCSYGLRVVNQNKEKKTGRRLVRLHQHSTECRVCISSFHCHRNPSAGDSLTYFKRDKYGSNVDSYDDNVIQFWSFPGTCLCLGAPEPAGKQEHLCPGRHQA